MLLAGFLTRPPTSFNMPLMACVLSLFQSCPTPSTLWTIVHQISLSMRFSSQECHARLTPPINILQSDLKCSLSKSVRVFCGMTCFSSLPPCLATLPCSSPPYHPFSPPSLWWHSLAGWQTPTPYLRSRSLWCFQGQSTKEYLSFKGTWRDGTTTSLMLTTVGDPRSDRISGHWKSSRQKECEQLSPPSPLTQEEMKNVLCSSSSSQWGAAGLEP